MDNGLLWASAVSALGLAAMGSIAIVVEPPLVGFEQLPNKIGATVAVEGDVASVDPRPQGWSRMRLQDQNASLEVLSEKPFNVSAGDRVRVTGQVGTFAGRIQLQLQSGEDLVVLRPWQDHHVPLTRLVQEAEKFRGTNVRTSGTIENRMLTGDQQRFGLSLRTSTYTEGAAIVEGLFDFEPRRAQYFLDVHRIEPILAAA